MGEEALSVSANLGCTESWHPLLLPMYSLTISILQRGTCVSTDESAQIHHRHSGPSFLAYYTELSHMDIPKPTGGWSHVLCDCNLDDDGWPFSGLF